MQNKAIKKANTKFLRGHEIEQMENVSFIKKQKRKSTVGINQLTLKEIHPLTDNQRKVFEDYDKPNSHLVLTGFPGTGKSFLAIYLSLRDIFYGDNGYNKLIIVRSLVSGRDIGHLPGSISEKQDPYFAPYNEICYELFGRGDAAEILHKKDILQFENTSFLRGMTFNNSIIIMDEFQNANFQELETINCRISDSSKILFCGDRAQSDLNYRKNDLSGFYPFLQILSNMQEFNVTDFEINDIVRGGMVKNYIITKLKLGL